MSVSVGFRQFVEHTIRREVPARSLPLFAGSAPITCRCSGNGSRAAVRAGDRTVVAGWCVENAAVNDHELVLL
jgi:hypothetical protein